LTGVELAAYRRGEIADEPDFVVRVKQSGDESLKVKPFVACSPKGAVIAVIEIEAVNINIRSLQG
jgi:hypothetical protein